MIDKKIKVLIDIIPVYEARIVNLKKVEDAIVWTAEYLNFEPWLITYLKVYSWLIWLEVVNPLNKTSKVKFLPM